MELPNNDLSCKRCKNERLLGSHLCRECTLKEQHKSALFVIESQKQELATLREELYETRKLLEGYEYDI